MLFRSLGLRMNAYMVFSKETRQKVIASNPGIRFGQIGKTLGKMYRDLSKEQIAAYEQKAKSLTPPKKISKAKNPGRSKRGTANPFMIFVKANQEKVPKTLKPVQRAKELGKLWRALPEAEKASYFRKSKEMTS
mmetsp:Transcript_6895/g.9245  ORF Transcript_6895/g.9245 Transcript_6895/m.9245 type:complete len:134 (+) Transcript_6895:55-456(+)